MPRNIILGTKINPDKLARAKELRRQMTPGETILWKCLRSNQLEGFHFRRQQVIQGLIADFYCHSAALVVEVDGGVHELQQDYDAERDRLLTALGLRVLRIREEDVLFNIDQVLKQILSTCQNYHKSS